jgi:pilus assembly protein CpaF
MRAILDESLPNNLPPEAEERARLDDLKRELHEQLLLNGDVAALNTITEDALRIELRRAAAELCRHRAQLLNQAEQEWLIDELIYETLGLGPLEPLMRDPNVSDILIDGPNTIYVERRGRLESTNVRFHDDDHLVDVIQRLAARVGRRIDESSPMVDARLPDGSRLNAVVRPLALDGALVSIRRFAHRAMSAADLVAHKSAPREMMDFLEACVRAKLNILISGGTGSGKTTLLNVLSRSIPEGERIVTIEDAAELQLQQPRVARMETRPCNIEGRGVVSTRDLLRNALRMRPDRIIIGECRGEEAFDMLQAMNTGHEGSLTTIHANDTRDALSRLEMLVGMAEHDVPLWFIHRQIASAIHIVVQVARMSGGVRRITRISEVTGVQSEVINMHDVFEFVQSAVNELGVSDGHFEATGIRPQCLERFGRSSINISPEVFERRRLDIDRVDGIRYSGNL